MRHKYDGKIGGSQIAMLMGDSPFGGPLSVWLDIKGLTTRETTDAMLWGEFMGPGLVRMYARREALHITHVGEREERIIHPTLALASTPDGLVRPSRNPKRKVTAPVEAKMPTRWTQKDWGDDAEAIPHHYIAQCVSEYGCTATKYDITGGYTLALAGIDNTVKSYKIKYSEEYFQILAEVAAKFIRDYVVTDKQPPANASDSEREALHNLYPVHELISIPSTEEIEQLRIDYLHGGLAEKEGKRIKQVAGNQLKQLMETAERVDLSDGKITWTNNADKEAVDYKGMVEELSPDADTLKRFTKIKQGARVLRVK